MKNGNCVIKNDIFNIINDHYVIKNDHLSYFFNIFYASSSWISSIWTRQFCHKKWQLCQKKLQLCHEKWQFCNQNDHFVIKNDNLSYFFNIFYASSSLFCMDIFFYLYLLEYGLQLWVRITRQSQIWYKRRTYVTSVHWELESEPSTLGSNGFR